jgi:DNA topoisomerase-2
LGEYITNKNQKKFEKDMNKNVKKNQKLKIPNLEDAHDAGSINSKNCTLILTEGLSAKTFAMSGLELLGRKLYGIFPLKGKLLNVRESSQQKMLDNAEIQNMMKILGMKLNYKNKLSDLRYGRVILLTDADVDGFHIKGLLMNVFHFLSPELLEHKGFLTTINTPLIKAVKGNSNIEFLTVQEYERWKIGIPDSEFKKYNIKYFKGLGTSSSKEALEIFKKMPENVVNYIYDSKINTDGAINLAFNKKLADDRKVWVGKYDKDMILDQTTNDLTYKDFINKQLIHFSVYDNLRSIPNLMDGLKPSQRKVLYTMFKNYSGSSEIKVSQLANITASLTNYHHGEDNLNGVIINLAQNFTGSNNYNLLEPVGQFGSRIASGKDASQPRYIFTKISQFSKLLFNSDDSKILNYINDEGQMIEPEFYTPNVPLILLNGAQGIGSGYSTLIPSFNLKDVLSNIKNILYGKSYVEMTPYYNGYKGEILKLNSQKFIMYGSIKLGKKENELIIDEIPINISIDDYKTFLDRITDEQILGIYDFTNESSQNEAKFIIKFKSRTDAQSFLKNKDENMKTLKLAYNINLSNMHLFDENYKIRKYESPEEIIIHFLTVKLEFVEKRRQYQLKTAQKLATILENKIRFINEFLSGKIKIKRGISHKELEQILEEHEYKRIEHSFDYLLTLNFLSITKEKIEVLEKQFLQTTKEIDYLKANDNIKLYLSDLK